MLRSQAAKKGKSSVIAMALARMAYTMERRDLDLKLEVLVARDPETVRVMAGIFKNWRDQGRYREVEPLAVAIVAFKKETLGPFHRETLRALYDIVDISYLLCRDRESESLATQLIEEQTANLGEDDEDTLKDTKVVWTSINTLQSIAESRNGACSSTESANADTPERQPFHNKD